MEASWERAAGGGATNNHYYEHIGFQAQPEEFETAPCARGKSGATPSKETRRRPGRTRTTWCRLAGRSACRQPRGSRVTVAL